LHASSTKVRISAMESIRAGNRASGALAIDGMSREKAD